MMNWKFQWIELTQESPVVQAAVDWQKQFTTALDARVFQEWPLIVTWMQTKGVALGITLRLCQGENQNGTKALIPFGCVPAKWRNGWQRRLVGIGEPHFDFQDPLFSAQNGNVIDRRGFWEGLERFLEESGEFDSAMLLRLHGEIASQNAEIDDAKEAPFIEMSRFASWAEYFSSLPATHRTDIRRQMRRLESQGELSFVIYEHESQLEEVLAELSKMRAAYERLWFKQPSGKLFQSPGTWEFYLEFVPKLLSSGFLHVSVLRLNGRSISWHFGFLHRRVLHYYKPTYESDVEKFSPGKIHLSRLLEHGFENEWLEFDFGGGTEDYKYRWATGARTLSRWQWNSKTFRARLGRTFRRWVKSILLLFSK